MTKQTIIPVGYRLTVTTWENDADNYKTSTLEGLSKEKVQYYVDLLKPFEHSYHQGTGNLGNIYQLTGPQEEQLKAHYWAILEKHKEVLGEDFVLEGEDEDQLMDIFNDELYDLDVRGGEQETRVVESIKIEYTPQAITFDDVTGEF